MNRRRREGLVLEGNASTGEEEPEGKEERDSVSAGTESIAAAKTRDSLPSPEYLRFPHPHNPKNPNRVALLLRRSLFPV